MDQATIDRLGELWLPMGALGGAAVMVLAAARPGISTADWPFATGWVAGVAAGADALPLRMVLALVAGVAVDALVRTVTDPVAPRWLPTVVGAFPALVIAGAPVRALTVLVPAVALAVIGTEPRAPRLRRAPAVLLSITVGGVWITVPDTEEATALLGAAALVLVVVLVTPLTSSHAGAMAAATAIASTIWLGSAGRDEVLIGCAVALLAVGLAPLIEAGVGRRPPDGARVVVHLVVTVVAARFGGTAGSVPAAALLGGAALLLGALVLAATARPVTRTAVT